MIYVKTFRTLKQAQKDLLIIRHYIHSVESYKPITLTQQIIYAYAILGNIHRTAEVISKKGIEITAEDVTTHITSKAAPDDHLHKLIKKLYRQKTRKNRIR